MALETFTVPLVVCAVAALMITTTLLNLVFKVVEHVAKIRSRLTTLEQESRRLRQDLSLVSSRAYTTAGEIQNLRRTIEFIVEVNRISPLSDRTVEPAPTTLIEVPSAKGPDRFNRL